jgi:hypothetical protein
MLRLTVCCWKDPDFSMWPISRLRFSSASRACFSFRLSAEAAFPGGGIGDGLFMDLVSRDTPR